MYQILFIWCLISFIASLTGIIFWINCFAEEKFFIIYILGIKEINIIGKILMILLFLPMSIVIYPLIFLILVFTFVITWHPDKNSKKTDHNA